MAYLDISQIAADGGIRQRVIACAYTEGIPDPQQWCADHAWTLAAQPGWGDAWASARAASKTDIGSDESVISDSAILSAVQSIVNAEAADTLNVAQPEGVEV